MLSLPYSPVDAARVSAIVACAGFLWSPTVATVGLIATYVAFVASGEISVRFRNVLARPAVYWGLIFLGLVLLGTLYGAVPWPERLVGVLKWRTILWFLVLLVLFDRQEWKDRLLVAFLAATTVGLMASFAAAGGIISPQRGPAGILRNSSTQGLAFAASALICFWRWLERQESERASWGWLLFGAIYVINIVFITPGMSGYGVMGIGLGVLLMYRVPTQWWVAVGAGIAICGVLAYSVSPQMQARVDRSVNEWVHADELGRHTPLGSRRVFHTNALEIAKEHWVVGVGTGGFRNAYAEHVARKYEASDWRAEPTGDPHNQYLAIWVTQGIVGLAAFLIWLVVMIRDRESVPRYRPLALALFISWCMSSLSSSHFTTFAEGHLIATFAGVLLANGSTAGVTGSPIQVPGVRGGGSC